jgi:hypothetical protein
MFFETTEILVSINSESWTKNLDFLHINSQNHLSCHNTLFVTTRFSKKTNICAARRYLFLVLAVTHNENRAEWKTLHKEYQKITYYVPENLVLGLEPPFHPPKIRQNKKNSKAGNWTPVSCVTGRNTNHYTTLELAYTSDGDSLFLINLTHCPKA